MNFFNSGCLFIFLFLSILYSQPLFDLPDDSASFGILISDYLSGEFEEGTTLNFPICVPCDNSGFPFDIFYQSPGDFGWIQFNYSETGDTVFYATIIWMGQGQIYFPHSFFSADSFFVESENSNDIPIEYWNESGNSTNDDSLIYYAQQAYEHIRKLTLVHQLTENPNQTLIRAYFYPPTVGMTDLTVAKWIFFLFRNPEVISVVDETPLPQNFKLYQPYPNPFNPTITIQFNIPVESLRATSLQIFNITGRLVETLVDGNLQAGEHEIVWKAGSQPSGVYFVRLQNGEFVENQKVVLIK
jgi:hypothetical protein